MARRRARRAPAVSAEEPTVGEVETESHTRCRGRAEHAPSRGPPRTCQPRAARDSVSGQGDGRPRRDRAMGYRAIARWAIGRAIARWAIAAAIVRKAIAAAIARRAIAQAIGKAIAHAIAGARAARRGARSTRLDSAPATSRPRMMNDGDRRAGWTPLPASGTHSDALSGSGLAMAAPGGQGVAAAAGASRRPPTRCHGRLAG